MIVWYIYIYMVVVLRAPGNPLPVMNWLMTLFAMIK